jgi:hypothetical protein
MTVRIDEKGEAQSVAVYQTENQEFSSRVGQLLMLTDYKPGKCNGTPCPMDFLFHFNFKRY